MNKRHKALAKEIAAQLVTEFAARSQPARLPAKRKPASKPVASAVPPVVEAKPARKLPKFSSTMVINSRQKPPKAASQPFSLPHFPPRVTEGLDQSRLMAQDSALSGTASWANTAWGQYPIAAAAEGVTFLGYPYLAELAQRPEYRVIVETLATERTRNWIEIQAKGDGDKSDKIEELEQEFKRLRVRQVFEKADEIDGYFGRGHIYIDTGDTDNPDELKTSIGNGSDKTSKAKVRKGSIRRLGVVEPIWTYPLSYNSIDPLKADWYNPQQWYVQAKEIHCSRLLRFVGREVPDLLKPAYSFGGLAMTQMAKPYVDNWLNVRQSVSDIIQAFTVFVLGTAMGETLSPGGEELFNRIDMFNNLRNNRGTMVIDKDNETFANVSAPLGTLDQLQAQAQEHMASVSRIPLVKLLGISPHGMNASSEGEIRVFYDTILASQQKFYGPNLDVIFAMAQRNIWGKVDPDLYYTFKPLWSLDEKAAAEARKVEAETGQILIDAGVLSPEEERARVTNDPNSPYPGLDIDDVPDLLEEEEEGLEPKGSAEHLAEHEHEADEDETEAA